MTTTEWSSFSAMLHCPFTMKKKEAELSKWNPEASEAASREGGEKYDGDIRVQAI